MYATWTEVSVGNCKERNWCMQVRVQGRSFEDLVFYQQTFQAKSSLFKSTMAKAKLKVRRKVDFNQVATHVQEFEGGIGLQV